MRGPPRSLTGAAPVCYPACHEPTARAAVLCRAPGSAPAGRVGLGGGAAAGGGGLCARAERALCLRRLAAAVCRAAQGLRPLRAPAPGERGFLSSGRLDPLLGTGLATLGDQPPALSCAGRAAPRAGGAGPGR